MNEKFWNGVNIAISHLKKSPVLQKTVSMADGIMDEMNKTFQHEPISLDSLVASLSPDTDKLILDLQLKDSIQFIGGELIVSIPSSKSEKFALLLQLYFKEQSGKVLLKENGKELELELLDKQSQQDLIDKGRISFEVEQPSTLEK